MATDIKNAIGLEKQFRPMPDAVYQKKLNKPEFGTNIGTQRDYGAERFAHSLGVIGDALWNEALANENRQKNQAKLINAQAMVAGKSANDLRNFDLMSNLQHAGGYDQTDNPYAIALLEKAMGEQAANNAMEQYLTDNEGKVPKSSEDAVQAYQGYLQKQKEEMGDSLVNPEAFDYGLNKANFENSYKISDIARQAIKNDRQATGQRTIATRFQKFMTNTKEMSSTRFKSDLAPLVREASLYFDTPEQASKFWNELFTTNGKLFTDASQLDAINDLEFFPGGHTFGKELPQGAIRKNIITSATKGIANDIIKLCTKPDGTIDIEKAKKMAVERTKFMKATATGGEWIVPSSGNTIADAALRKEALTQGVPLNVAYAVFHIENRDNQDVIEGKKVSSAGAIGAMQLMPDTAKGLDVDPYDIADNIKGGIKYLKQLYDEFGDWRLAALHYNCGPGGNINNSETQKYGELYDEYLGLAKKNPHYGKQLNPTVSDSEIEWEPGIKEKFEKGQQAKWFGIVPQIIGKLKAAGVKEPIITSAYRPDGELNDAGAGERSLHHQGDAMDIWIGDDYDHEHGDPIAKVLAPYFNFVQFEKKGEDGATGDHVHMEGYNGGLEATDNQYDYNATAYSEDTASKVMQYVEQENADREKVKAQKHRDAIDQLKVVMNNNDLSYEERKNQVDAIDGLTDGDKAQYKGMLDKAAQRESRAAAIASAKLANANMSPEERLGRKYYKNGQYTIALNTKTMLDEKVANGDTLTDAEEKQLKDANTKIIITEEVWQKDAYVSLGWFGGRYVGYEKAKMMANAAKGAYMIGKSMGMDTDQMKEWFNDYGIPHDEADLDSPDW